MFESIFTDGGKPDQAGSTAEVEQGGTSTEPQRRMKPKGGSSPKILIKPKEGPPTRRSGQSAGCITPIFGGRVTNQVGCTSDLSKQAQHQIVAPIDLHMQVDITILSRFGSGR